MFFFKIYLFCYALFHGGNYRLISRNLGVILAIIERSRYGRSLRFENQVYAAAAWDCSPYIYSGQIGAEHIRLAIDFAQLDMVCLSFVNRSIRYNGKTLQLIGDDSETRFALSAVLNFICLMMSADSNFPDRDIVNAVLKKQTSIAKAFIKAWKNPTKYIGIFNRRMSEKRYFIDNERFIELIKVWEQEE